MLERADFVICEQGSISLTFSVEGSNEINGIESKVKKKYFQFSTRWNRAKFMIPLRLRAVLI